MSNDIYLSLIIPVYNEEKIINHTLKEVLKYLSKKPFSWEVIVVDDGSNDLSSKIVEDFKKKKVKLVKQTPNQGKGAALRLGVEKSKGNFIIYSDADLSVPLENIAIFLSRLKKNDVVISSRRARGAKIVVHQPWLRENMGRVYSFLSQLVTGIWVSDFTCGFKGFEKKAAKDLFACGLLDRWAYDSEILFLAKKHGYKICEVPVAWTNRKETRVVLRRAVIASFIDLFKIRVNDLLSKYNRK